MTASASMTVSVTHDAFSVTNMAGREVTHGTSIDFSVTYAPGQEDDAIRDVLTAADDMVRQIHAARPAAASTPPEGLTP